jgi:uncharacterized protein
MKAAIFQFHGDVNDLLPAAQRGIPQRCTFQGDQSVKHLIESMRIPHTEVGLVKANQLVVETGYLVQDNDVIDVYPNILQGVESSPQPGFLLDNHLGKLATFLRILGFDAAYNQELQDDELAQMACLEGRILLSRDRGLLMRRIVTRGYLLSSLEPKEQLSEVIRRFDLVSAIQPFQRCLKCNHPLIPVEKEAILERLQPLTRRYFDEFHICPACAQIYWKGSHYDHMQLFLSSLGMEKEDSDE